jgi:hypothetical protein
MINEFGVNLKQIVVHVASKFNIRLDFPNIASDEDGNVGFWTIIYNQVKTKKLFLKQTNLYFSVHFLCRASKLLSITESFSLFHTTLRKAVM